MPPLPTAWAVLIAAYTVTQAASGAPATTQRARREHLEHLARRIGAPLADVTGELLLSYAGAQAWATETRRSRRTTFRSFWTWALAAGHTVIDAAAALPRVKPSKPLPRPTPTAVYEHALAGADDRVRLMLRLACECGLRRSEVALMHSDDVIEDLVGWSLVVHGKGGKRRIVPCPPGLAMHVLAAGGYAFPGAVDGHLSPRRVGELVRDQLPGAWTMHSLRHRAASRWYAVEKDVFTVQELLGHASPVTTRTYVEVPSESLRRTVYAAL